MSFALYDAAVNTELFINFIAALMHDTAPAKVSLTADRLSAHRAAKVHDWLSDKADRIELCLLPSYAPQFSPDEWLNRDLNTKMRTRPAIGDCDALKRMACDFVHSLPSLPQRVMGYFRHEYVAYASAELMYCV